MRRQSVSGRAGSPPPIPQRRRTRRRAPTWLPAGEGHRCHRTLTGWTGSKGSALCGTAGIGTATDRAGDPPRHAIVVDQLVADAVQVRLATAPARPAPNVRRRAGSATSAATAAAIAAPSRGGHEEAGAPGLRPGRAARRRPGRPRARRWPWPPARPGRRSRTVRCGRTRRGWRRAGPAAVPCRSPRNTARRQRASQRRPGRAVADHDHPHAGQPARRVREQVHPLLRPRAGRRSRPGSRRPGRAPARTARRGGPGGTGSRRRRGATARLADAVREQRRPRSTWTGPACGRARRARAAATARRCASASAHAVRAGVPGHVGLVDRDDRQVQRGRRRRRPTRRARTGWPGAPRRAGARAARRVDLAAGQAEPERRVAGQRHRGHPHAPGRAAGRAPGACRATAAGRRPAAGGRGRPDVRRPGGRSSRRR